MAKLKDTPFSSGTKDALATVDVYNENSKQSINKRNKVADGTNSVNDKLDMADRLTNDKRYQSNMISKLLGKKLNPLVGGSKELSLIARYLNKDQNLLTDLLPENLSILLKLLSKNQKKKVKVGDRYRNLSDYEISNYNNANDLYKSIVLKNIELKDIEAGRADGTISYSPNEIVVKDINSEAVTYGTVINTFLQLNDTDSILKALNEITDIELKKTVLLNILESVIQTANVDILSIAINDLGVGTIIGLYPNIVESILANYNFPIGTKPSEWPAIRTKILTTIEKINPEWYLIKRKDIKIRNARPFMRMSTSIITLLLGDPLHVVSCMISDSYKETNILNLLKKSYPLFDFQG